MREIKFRAWNPDGGEMTRPWGLDEIADRGPMFKDTHWPVMQWTGLRDKNGVEIYEGDVVRVPWDGESVVVELGPLDGNFHFLVTEYGNCTPAAFEVVGNIHENPELLDAG